MSTALFVCEEGVVELEVLEELNKVQEPLGSPRVRNRSVGEKRPKHLHEAGYSDIIYSKYLRVRECGKITQGASDEQFGSEPGPTRSLQADPESIYEREQAELVRLSEWPRSEALPVWPGATVIGRESVMEVRNGGDVPQVTCQGEC